MIDGEFVTDDPDVLLESGRVNQKDVMNGVNKDEGTFFISMRFIKPPMKNMYSC